MTDLSWVREIKEIESGIGYVDEEDIRKEREGEVNALLNNGWHLIAFVTDQKYSLEFNCAITHQYYILGR